MPQGKRVEWEDLGNLRHELFHVWAFGGDTGWAEASWRRLTGLGLTDYDVENERRIVLIRLCAVTRRHFSAGANPARQLSLQPVTVGADDGGNDIV